MFGNVLTAMVTPYNDRLEVNYESAARMAAHLAATGSDGIVVAGTTGEPPNLSLEEKLTLFKVVKEAVGSSCRVIAGAGTYSTRESVEIAGKLDTLDVDGILAVVPYYNKPSQEGLYQHFKAIAEATELPVMLYNIPGRTSLNMLPQTVARLSETPNIVSVKEAAGSMDQVSELKKLLPEDFAIYSGDDSLTLPMLALGATGIVSVCAHLVGRQIKKMVTAFMSGDHAEALKWHMLLYSVFKGLFITTNPVPVKYLMNLAGFDAGGYRLPLVGPTPQEQEFLKELYEQIKRLPETL